MTDGNLRRAIGPISRDMPAAEATLSVSVIISTYNRADVLADCLIALRHQSHPNFEVIVVAGPCTDTTGEVIAAHGAGCKVVHCTERNLSKSRNLGIAAAAGDICAFIDDDAVAHPDWLAALVARYADPAVGGVGGFTIDNTGTSYQCRYTVCDRFGNATLLDHIDPESRLSQAGLWIYPSLLGTNSSFRTAVLRRIGGFDAAFEYMLDETDVCARLVDAGYAVVTAAAAVVFHRYAPSHVRDHRRIAKTLVAPSRSKAHFVYKHAGPRLPLADLSTELDRFRNDLRFSNRWHVDRTMIDSQQFLRLNAEVDIGLHQGIGSGAQAASAVPAPLDDGGHAHETLRCYRDDSAAPRLRIALVSQGYPPRDTAGIARWTQELAQALAERGHHVHVITASAEPRSIDYRRGVWVHAVPSVEARRALAPVDLPGSILARATAVLDEARLIQKDFGLDVLSAPIWDVEGILCAANLDIPVLTSLHTAYKMVLPMKEKWRSDLPFRLHHVDKVIGAERWLLANSSLLLANSHEICRELRALYGETFAADRVAVVPHGLAPVAPHAHLRAVSEGAVSNREVSGREMSGRAASGRTVRLLYVGRIERRKGLDLLLEAVLKLFATHPGIELDVVGAEVPEEGSFASRIAELRAGIVAGGFADRVAFHGYVDEQALSAFYAGCDVFVAPSRFESFGLIAIEAMRHAKPVVATRVGGLVEIVEDGVSGALFTPDSAESLRDALEDLLSAPAKRNRMGQRGAALFAERFTSDEMARGVERCLFDLLAGRDDPRTGVPPMAQGGTASGTAGGTAVVAAA